MNKLLLIFLIFINSIKICIASDYNSCETLCLDYSNAIGYNIEDDTCACVYNKNSESDKFARKSFRDDFDNEYNLGEFHSVDQVEKELNE